MRHANQLNKMAFDIQGSFTKSFTYMMRGGFQQAKQLIGAGISDLSETNNQVEPLQLIAQAVIAFNEGNIQETLSNLKKVINNNPYCPEEIWFAIGVCYFKLNNLPKAKFALEHVLELNPDNA